MTADTHCGHPAVAIVSSDEGTSYCRWCEEVGRAREEVGRAREEGRRAGLGEAAALLDGDDFDPWPAVKRIVNVAAMNHGPGSNLEAIIDAVFEDACREIRILAGPDSPTPDTTTGGGS